MFSGIFSGEAVRGGDPVEDGVGVGIGVGVKVEDEGEGGVGGRGSLGPPGLDVDDMEVISGWALASCFC